MVLTIISDKGVVTQQPIRNVSLPGVLGTFMVLPNHAPIVSALRSGVVSFLPEKKEEKQEIQVIKGFAEVKQGDVWVYIEQ